MLTDLSIPVYLLHPMAVHFPIALLVVGFGMAAAAQWPARPLWLRPALPWVLVAGTLALWVTLGLGLLAEHSAPHVPPAWRTLAAHEQRAWLTAGAFTLLSGLGLLDRGRHPRALLLGWAVALVPLVLTAHLGAQLVYTFGMGSQP